MKICLPFLFVLVALNVNGQPVVDLLKETSLAYREAKNFSADVIVHTYSSANDAGTLLGKGLIRKSGINYYSLFLNDELIVNKECTVVLDHGEKTVTWYNEGYSKKEKKRKGQQLPDIDSLYTSRDSVRYQGIENGQRHFIFYSRSVASSIRMTEVFTDDQTHFITRIVYYYRNNVAEEVYDMYKVVIDYTAISTEEPPASFFSEKKYISYTKGKPRLASPYLNYKLFIEQ